MIELTDNNFENLTAKGVWIVEFGVWWCRPCSGVKLVLDALEVECPKVLFGYADAYSCPKMMDKLRIIRTPTILLLDSNMEKVRLTGYHTKEELRGLIMTHSGKDGSAP